MLAVTNVESPEMLYEVTQRLGVAFSTTLLALVMASILVFVQSLIQGREELYLRWFFEHYAYDPSAVSPEDVEVWLDRGLPLARPDAYPLALRRFAYGAERRGPDIAPTQRPQEASRR